MKVVSEASAKEKLEPYIDDLNYCIDKGIQESKEFLKDKLLVLSNRSKSSNTRDFIIENVKILVEQSKDKMWITIKRAMFTLCIKVYDGTTFVIRFKKLNNNLSTSNIGTKQALLFNSQQPVLPFASNENVIHLNAGYVLKSTALLEGNLNYITCPNGKSLDWSFELNNSADMTTSNSNIQTLPKENTNEKSILRIKTKTKKAGNSES